MTKSEVPSTELLEKLGFKRAATIVTQHREAAPTELRNKLRIAFEHFRVVTPEQAGRFADELKKKTHRSKTISPATRYNGRTVAESWMKPVYTTIDRYPLVPPIDVLEALQKAMELKCFDEFEVLTIGVETRHVVTQRPAPVDPVLFGRITGSDNRYYIAQWDDDVAIEDILREDEG